MVEQQWPKAEEIRRADFGGAGVCRAHRNDIKISLAWFWMEGELAALIWLFEKLLSPVKTIMGI